MDVPVFADQEKLMYIYIYQVCVDTGCSLEDLLGAMDDRDRWGVRVRKKNP